MPREYEKVPILQVGGPAPAPPTLPVIKVVLPQHFCNPTVDAIGKDNCPGGHSFPIILQNYYTCPNIIRDYNY